MPSFNEIYDEVEDLRGLLTAFKVVYPDTSVRLDPAIEKIDKVLVQPTPESIYYVVEDMQNLLIYFGEIERMAPELNTQLGDIRELINRLLGPTNPESKAIH